MSRITQTYKQNRLWWLSIMTLITGVSITYLFVGNANQVFFHAQHNLSVAESKKMAELLAEPKKLEKMLLTTVVKNPQDHHAWLWLARLYTQQKRWPSAGDAAYKSFKLSKSVSCLLLWCHILHTQDPDMLIPHQDTIRDYAEKYPEHEQYWKLFIRTKKASN